MADHGQSLLARLGDVVLLPLVNLLAAFMVSGIIIALLGEDPWQAMQLLVYGAFGYGEAVGYTLYYATNFIFTGLAVTVAFRAGLFNIGGEGQVLLGGVGLTLVVLLLPDSSPWVVLPLGVVGAALAGAIWALLPAYLQARRGSHIVITTIMMNYIAASLLAYLLAGPMARAGAQALESEDFPAAGQVPSLDPFFDMVGLGWQGSPLNLSFVLALLVAFVCWLLLFRSRKGYEISVVGANPNAARFAGIPVARTIIIAMLVAGGTAGLMSLNELGGLQHRLIANFATGFGFVGIAVAFMGRNHPLGVVLAAILFGALYQGGAELAFDMPAVTRDMIVVIQGLVILFTGAMPYVFRRLTLRGRAGRAVPETTNV